MRGSNWLCFACCALLVPFLWTPAQAGEPAAQPTKKVEVPDLGTRKAGSDWPGFLGPNNDGSSSEKGILTTWPKDGLRVVWHRRLGEGYGAPSISKGRLFYCDRHENRGRVTALKSETGEELWHFDYPTDYEDLYGYNNGPRCCPVVDDDRLYTYGAEGMLHCLRVTDGHLLWKVDTKTTFGVVQNFFGVASVPVVEGDLLIVQVGGSPPSSGTSPTLDQKGNGTGIVAFDKRTGSVAYKITDELASYSSPVVRTVNGRRWCFVFARGGMVGFDPASGQVDFHYPWRAKVLESVNAINPVVVDDQVFVSECYGPGSALLKVRPKGYDVTWSDVDKGRNKAMQSHWSTPVYDGGFLYGDSGRHSGACDLRCVDFATGQLQWRKPGLGHCALLKVDGHLVCLLEDGPLLLLKTNPKQFEVVTYVETIKDAKGEALLEYPCWAAPALSYGLLYLRGKDRMVCLELIP